MGGLQLSLRRGNWVQRHTDIGRRPCEDKGRLQGTRHEPRSTRDGQKPPKLGRGCGALCSEPSDRTDPAGAFILTSGPQNSEGIYVHGFRDVCNNFLQHGKKVT